MPKYPFHHGFEDEVYNRAEVVQIRALVAAHGNRHLRVKTEQYTSGYGTKYPYWFVWIAIKGANPDSNQAAYIRVDGSQGATSLEADVAEMLTHYTADGGYLM